MTKVRNNFDLVVTPIVIVLFQELERFNKLIKKMNTTLTQLKKVNYFSFFFFFSCNIKKTDDNLLIFEKGYSWRNKY